LAALQEVRGPREGPKYQSKAQGTTVVWAEPTADEQFASAFRDWGLDVDVMPAAEAAARLKARPAVVVTGVIAALDEWADERRQGTRAKAPWQKPADLAGLLDNEDPGSKRRELREILARGQLPLERALGVLSAALRPVPVPVIVPIGEDRARLRRLAEKVDPVSEPVLGLLTLTGALRMAGEEVLAEQFLRAALRARPREGILYYRLGQLLSQQKPPRWAEAVECWAAARALRPDLGVHLSVALLHSGRTDEGLALLARMGQESPDNPFLHYLQGLALHEEGKFKEAEAAFRQAIERKSNYAEAYNELGVILIDQGKPGDAEEACRKAIALKPDYAVPYHNLGNALVNQERPVEAEEAFRKAIKLKPDLVIAYNSLGIALMDQGKPVDAEKACREAIACKPDYADAYNTLGNALMDQGKPVDAEKACRAAITCKPDYVEAYNTLGAALTDQGKLVDAEAACRKAIALKPDYAEPNNTLGGALILQGKPAQAEALYRKAIALKPDLAVAYTGLGVALRLQGRFEESLEAYRRGHELGSKRPNSRHPFLQWVREAERYIELEKKLPAILSGEEPLADAKEALTLAWIYQQPYQKRYAASARLYAIGFAAGPKFAADVNLPFRYNAACSAALAAAGQGEDARQLPDKVAANFRRRALGWLRDHLTAYAKLAGQNNPAAKTDVQQRLTNWRSDPDLASVRDPQALERLPEKERAAWQALWRDVDELAARLKKADGSAAPKPREPAPGSPPTH
jgi:Tfp pilus assembly protein PilF